MCMTGNLGGSGESPATQTLAAANQHTTAAAATATISGQWQAGPEARREGPTVHTLHRTAIRAEMEAAASGSPSLRVLHAAARVGPPPPWRAWSYAYSHMRQQTLNIQLSGACRRARGWG